MRTHLVHEWLGPIGGSELVLEALAALYPQAPIHALVYWRELYAQREIGRHEVRTSFIDRLPTGRRRYTRFLPLMPLAVEGLDTSDAEVVISSSHAVAKGVLTRADQLHISYVHTPMRYAWDMRQAYLQQTGLDRGLRGKITHALLHYLRNWDIASANRVDHYLANSHYIARRIAKTYRRDSQVIYPPVDVERFTASTQRDDFYLTVSRLVPYKRIDLIAAAMAKLDRPLVIIGDGPERAKIEAAAASAHPGRVTLLGYQDDSVVRDHLQRCRAFLFAAEEDFGIVPVEAQAAGAPVIALGKGGVRETVIDGRTGVFFFEQSLEGLTRGIEQFEAQPASHWDASTIAAHAQQFSTSRFKRELAAFVNEAWTRFRTERDNPHSVQ